MAQELDLQSQQTEDEEELRRKSRMPRIIRQASGEASKVRQDLRLDDSEMEQGQVIVIGLDQTGQQPSEEQLTAIFEVNCNNES